MTTIVNKNMKDTVKVIEDNILVIAIFIDKLKALIIPDSKDYSFNFLLEHENVIIENAVNYNNSSEMRITLKVKLDLLDKDTLIKIITELSKLNKED